MIAGSRRRRPRWKASAALAAPLVVLLVCLFLFVPAAPAADAGGAIVGKVASGETGGVLPFVPIECVRTDAPAGSAAEPVRMESRGDGTYGFDVEPGVYRLSARSELHRPLDVNDVHVAPGEVVQIDLILQSRAGKLETVDVSAKRIRNTETALLLERKYSGAITDGIHADQIGRSSDSNAAEVVTRMTGLSVVGGKYVFVRGLGERYSSSMINGAMVSSPEPNRRVLPLDMFPSGVIEAITVQKTYTPDLPGDFGGGLVNIRTRTFPHREQWSVSVSGSGNTSTTGEDFLRYEGGKYDYLGFSGDSRAVPDLIEELAADRVVREAGVAGNGFTGEEIAAMGRSFNRIWEPETASGPMARSISLSYGNRVDVLSRALGFQASASLSRGYSGRDFERNQISDLSEETGVYSLHSEYKGTESTETSLLGLLFDAGYRASAAHKVRANAFYTRASEDETRTYEGPNNDFGVPLRDARFRFVERGVLTGFVGMDHTFPFLNDAQFDWRINYSEAVRDEPDRREYIYELRESTGLWELSSRTASSGFTRFFQYLDEIERGYGWNLAVPLRTEGGFDGRIKVGYLTRDKSRHSRLRRFSFRNPTGPDWDRSAPPSELMTDEMIGGGSGNTGVFQLQELTRATDNYEARQTVDAAYALVDVPLPGNLRVLAGTRVEEAELSVVTANQVVNSDSSDVAHLHDVDWLPAVNVTWSPTRTQNVRAGFSRTVSRPDLRELSSLSLTDYQNGYEEVGNPDLVRARITGYDLRWEMFPTRSETLAMSVFHKTLEDPIEKTARGGSVRIFQPINGQGATNYGAEFELHMNLGRFAERLEAYEILSNLTLVHSETDVSADAGSPGAATSAKRRLQGQSDYVFNSGLQWSTLTGTTTWSVMVNSFGKRILEVGADGVPDNFEQPRWTLDATASHKWRGLRFKAGVENILNAHFDQKQGTVYTERYTKGTSASLGITYGS